MFLHKITQKHNTDSGMALTLILLLIGYFSHSIIYYSLAIPVLVVTMTFPKLFYPFAIVWLATSHIVGTVISTILLTIVYGIFVVPVGLLRKLLGKDSLVLTQFKKGKNSVFHSREHTFGAKDIENPY